MIITSFFFSQKEQYIKKNKKIQRLGDIKPDPGTTQMGIHHYKSVPVLVISHNLF